MTHLAPVLKAVKGRDSERPIKHKQARKEW